MLGIWDHGLILLVELMEFSTFGFFEAIERTTKIVVGELKTEMKDEGDWREL